MTNISKCVGIGEPMTTALLAFRLIDGSVVMGLVDRTEMPDEIEADAHMTDYTLHSPVLYAVVQKDSPLAGQPPKFVPAMQKYSTVPLLGAVVSKLFLQYTQIIGVPEEITAEEVVALYSRTVLVSGE